MEFRRVLFRSTPLLGFQGDSVDINRSNVLEQHRRVCRIKIEPLAKEPSVAEVREVNHALRISTRNANSIDAQVMNKGHEVNELAISRPSGPGRIRFAQHRPSLRA